MKTNFLPQIENGLRLKTKFYLRIMLLVKTPNSGGRKIHKKNKIFYVNGFNYRLLEGLGEAKNNMLFTQRLLVKAPNVGGKKSLKRTKSFV